MTLAARLRMIPLGSGSSGNCIAVTDDETTVLVDCGFSAREVSRRLTAVGLDAAAIDAILVTHEHGDHIRGIEVFCRRHARDAVVYASAGTSRSAGLGDVVARTVSLKPGESARIRTLSVVPFRTSHDAAEPFGYRIERESEAIGIATDTGAFTEEVAEGLAGCQVVGIESNHDVEMLERGPYPYYLKRRIMSEQGHLSNGDAASALERLASDNLRRVFALHQSRTNNTARLARSALSARLSRIGLDVPVVVASQYEPCS